MKYPILDKVTSDSCADDTCMVDGDNGTYKIYENPAQRVFMGKRAEAAPRQKKSPELKEAIKEFSKPDMSEAELTIAPHRGLGMDGWEVNLSLPVSVDFLKAKKMDMKVDDFASFNSSDPIEILVMMVNKWLPERVGMRLGRPSLSTVDLSRQRAKNGMKEVSMNFEVNNPLDAYALGMNLDEWSYRGQVPPKEEIAKRKKLAEQKAQEGAEIRQNKGPDSDAKWKAYIEEIKGLGMNWKIAKSIPVASSQEVDSAVDKAALVESLSEVFHDAWMHWSKSVADQISDPERVARWKTFWVPYDQLDEPTKDLDREWAEEAFKKIEPLVKDDKMAKEMVTRMEAKKYPVTEKMLMSSEHWDGPADWRESLALTLLSEAVASLVEEQDDEGGFNEFHDDFIRSQEDIVDNVEHVIQSEDFGGHRFLPTGLVDKMAAATEKMFAGKSTLEELYDEYPNGAHGHVLMMLGHGVSLDDDKEGVEWMKEKGITRDMLHGQHPYFESDYDSAYGFLEALKAHRAEEHE